MSSSNLVPGRVGSGTLQALPEAIQSGTRQGICGVGILETRVHQEESSALSPPRLRASTRGHRVGLKDLVSHRWNG